MQNTLYTCSKALVGTLFAQRRKRGNRSFALGSNGLDLAIQCQCYNDICFYSEYVVVFCIESLLRKYCTNCVPLHCCGGPGSREGACKQQLHKMRFIELSLWYSLITSYRGKRCIGAYFLQKELCIPWQCSLFLFYIWHQSIQLDIYLSLELTITSCITFCCYIPSK